MIRINGEDIDIKNVNLLEYLKENGFNKNRVAVELNEKIVKRDDFEKTMLSSDDKVEIVHFVGGG